MFPLMETYRVAVTCCYSLLNEQTVLPVIFVLAQVGEQGGNNMRLTKTVLGLTAVIAITAIGGGTVHAQTAPHMVAVQSGDMLSTIAAAHDTTSKRLFDATPTIEDPNIIHPGDLVRIPAPDEQLASRPLPGAEVTVPTLPAVAVPVPAAAAPAAASPATVPPAPADPPVVAASPDNEVWDKLAACESDGNWSADGPTYHGGLQFTQSTWEANGGAPGSNPAAASREQQISVAKNVQASQGWDAWPACSKELDL